MPLTENFIWFLFVLIAFVSIYSYRILHTRALKALANTTRIQSDPKSLKKLNKQIKKKLPNFMSTLVGVLLGVALVFTIYKFYEWNRTKTISKFEAIATTAMQDECTVHCSSYNITQNMLIGPQLEQDCCYGLDNHPNYIFTWQSYNPKVILKENVNAFGTNAVWLGTRVNENIESTTLVRNNINSTIQQNQHMIDAAYTHALEITPSMHGSFAVIHLIIAPNGQVTQSEIISTDINSVDLKNNITKLFSSLRFSSGNYQIKHYTYYLQLKQK